MTISMTLARAIAVPDEVRAEILAAYREAGCSDKDAARRLDLPVNTYRKVVERLAMRASMRALKERAKAEGWHHLGNRRSPGRPRTAPPPSFPEESRKATPGRKKK